MTVSSVTSASAGTKLSTGADTKVTGITMTQPSSTADLYTSLTLVDAAVTPIGSFRALYNAYLLALSFVFGNKPSGPSVAPGLTAPTWPQTISSYPLVFSSGLFVLSCPSGVTFSITTAP